MGKSFSNEPRFGEVVAVERIEYRAGNTACKGALVYDEKVGGRRPLMLIAPNWLGVTEDASSARRRSRAANT